MNLDKQQVAKQFDKSARVYDSLAAMQRQIVDRLLDEMVLPKRQAWPVEICDLGCGTGYALSRIAEFVPQSNMAGVDLAPSMLEVARKNLAKHSGLDLDLGSVNIDLIQGDIESVPLPSGRIDLCVSSSAIQWCEAASAMNEIARVLKPGGQALVSSFAAGTLSSWRALWGSVNDQQFLSSREFNQAADAAGLSIDKLWLERKVQSFNSFSDALASVRDLGAGNAGRARNRGLMSSGRLKNIIKQVDAQIEREGSIDLVYNVIYLSAYKPVFVEL